jgi:hypothetical protein
MLLNIQKELQSMNISFPKTQSHLWTGILIHQFILSFKPGIKMFPFHERNMSVLSCVLNKFLFLGQSVISLQYLRTKT